jgi:hypothetical protein
MGQDQRDMLIDYWSTLEWYFRPLYRNKIKQDSFYHIPRFLHFSDNENENDNADENYDGLWKMRSIFDKLNNSYAKYYSPTKHFAVNETICPSKVQSSSNSIHRRNTSGLG